ncbi:hypothetical protein NLJ89_g1870 [Agrocybe chaxingu]|uniref:Major facilitator superfamily (MFS) profile domain-containing protein n=1 Tax=Agrocybe chaxingu TaxID=84603 RepID=A0A9W8TDM4_9AGAR|nr:hypothetical protein NLJ89_g1870 [Agrocybe chaxingu]
MANESPSPRRRLVGEPLLYVMTIFVSLGVFLFGYDQGVMSGIITGPYFRKYFEYPGPIEVGTMVAVLEIGAFITSVAAGRVGDIIGRKGTLFMGAVIFTFGGAIQTFTLGFWSMVVGRIVSGFGVGLLSWLIDTGKETEGMQVIADLHGGNPNNPVAVAEYDEIKDKVLEDRASGEERSYQVMWRKYKRRVLLAMSSQAFAQLNGINVISYYAPRVFEQAGWIGRQAILMTGINSIIYVLSTLPPWYLVDRWGRRAILLSGAVIMAASLVATGWWMYIDVPQTPNAVVLCVIIFNAAFGYSWGPIPWLYPPEIMPLNFRAKGVSLSTATNWAFNWIVGESTPYLQERIEWRLYPMHGFFCICSFVLVYFLYPETKGVPLEEMDAVFGEEAREEQLDNESETTSLVQGPPADPERLRTSRTGFEDTGNERRPSWLSRLFAKNRSRSDYEPISHDDH